MRVRSSVVEVLAPSSEAEEVPRERLRAAPVWLTPLGLYGAVLSVLLLVSWWSISRFTETPDGMPPVSFRGEWFWDGWVRYDAGWYSIIADTGYSYAPGVQSPVAFFPGYPMVVRQVARLTDNIQLAGILVTLVCGALVLVAFHRWCRDRLDPAAAVTAVACLALYPYAYYLYGAMYGDALFVLLALVAFLAFERDHLLLAGLAGAAATGTRLVGVAVVAGLVVGVLERRRVLTRGEGRLPQVHLRRLAARDAWVLLSIGGLAAWSSYLWRRFGDPLLFSSVQESWGQQSGLGTWLKRDFFATIARWPDRFYTHGLVIQSALGLLVLAATPTVVRRFGWRYGTYLVVLLLIPAIGSQDFQGLGRYLLGAFPAFAVLGAFLAERPGLRRLVLPASAAVLVLFTGLFANGRYLS
ncbi:MAG TPA: glycosyltransferase family 39 protein [Acidimicrobiales bacterium]|nr:glycosyltransferase family 39 protein [Acidimicrobiales bacterium]